MVSDNREVIMGGCGCLLSLFIGALVFTVCYFLLPALTIALHMPVDEGVLMIISAIIGFLVMLYASYKLMT